MSLASISHFPHYKRRELNWAGGPQPWQKTAVIVGGGLKHECAWVPSQIFNWSRVELRWGFKSPQDLWCVARVQNLWTFSTFGTLVQMISFMTPARISQPLLTCSQSAWRPLSPGHLSCIPMGLPKYARFCTCPGDESEPTGTCPQTGNTVTLRQYKHILPCKITDLQKSF